VSAFGTKKGVMSQNSTEADWCNYYTENEAFHIRSWVSNRAARASRAASQLTGLPKPQSHPKCVWWRGDNSKLEESKSDLSNLFEETYFWSISPTFYAQLLRVQIPKSAKRYWWLDCLFALLGSAGVKAFVNLLTPDHNNPSILELVLLQPSKLTSELKSWPQKNLPLLIINSQLWKQVKVGWQKIIILVFLASSRILHNWVILKS